MMDNLIKLKQWLDKLNKNNDQKIKTKCYILKHTFPPLHRIEQHKETAGGNLYYIDYKHKASISAFCVFGTCPTPPTVT